MKITFLGGADEVGASCSLIEIADKLILVDAGIRISPRTNHGIQNSQLPDLQPISAVGGPDFILVTHAHTDHTGALPLILEQYPHVPVIATEATQSLTRVLQLDAQRIMKSRQEQEGELPLFDEISVQRLMDAFQTIEFNKPLKLGEGLQVTYYTAGHIAGAAVLVFESGEGTLVMSGDISKSEQRTVKSVVVPPIKADALVLESTYGGKLHANRVGEEKRLMQTLQRVTERGGKVLIPAFALGRAQEVIQIILAYGAEFDVPVYVDGMVRTVCDAYQTFSDILPKSAVRMAGNEHLFFRGQVKPIRSNQHRMEIAMRDKPAVVVASSGMLTGGASVVYAKHFAPDERNAILLTGYQDEEAPGRFLQRIMKQRQDGDTPTLKFDDITVKVRCEIGTYSLSAHADEMELVSFADALQATDIMLVHGDPNARHSLATALRQRGKSVTTPKIGQTKVLTYQERPWGVGKINSGNEVGAVDLYKLWESLKDRANDFFSIRELAQVWWGNADRASELKTVLEGDTNLYFSADWRNNKNYKVKSQEQVERSQRSRAIMLANPDIIGKLIVMRNSNGQPRLAVVNGADVDSFSAIVQNQRGTNHPADALLWVIGEWEKLSEENSIRANLTELHQEIRKYKDIILPYSERLKLAEAEQAILPELLIPDTIPDDLNLQTVLSTIVMALAEDGATLERDGLLPQRAREHGPLEQNEARDLAMQIIPDDAYLRKVGMDIHRKRLTLTFDFPDTIQRRFGQEIERIIEQTGWEVYIKPTVNQQALGIVADEIMPEGTTIKKGPSYYMDKGQVHYELTGISDEQVDKLRQNFRDLTGFDLVVINKVQASSEIEDTVTPIKVDSEDQLEINAAYGLIRSRLNTHGLNKTSLKQGQIVLTFISPQVGERHMDLVRQLMKETGYTIRIHPHPNQHKILQTTSKLLREVGWTITKGPGIHTDRAELSIKIAEDVDDETLTTFNQKLIEETGYKVVVT
jgi:Cft2 family RNA processing exonuclease